ncbi:MAG: RodZ domain-containing protein [Chloroflexota bacterium]
MGELGNSLRAARESRGLSTQAVEEAIRIRRVFIEALEDERFGDLPGDVYARGFLRTYARYLGLEPDALLAEYRKMRGIKPPADPVVLNEPLLRRVRPSPWSLIFALAMLLLVIGVVGWYVYSRFYLGADPWPTGWAWPTWPVKPTAVASPASADSPTPVGAPSQNALDPARVVATTTATALAVILPTYTPTAVETSLPSPTPRPLVTRTATPTIAPSPTTAPTSEALEGIRVQAKVLAPTYVEVRLDATTLAPVILQPGQDPTWEAKETVLLRIGNAAGIQLTVNGVEVGPLGAAGEVVGLVYTRDNLPRPTSQVP